MTSLGSSTSIQGLKTGIGSSLARYRQLRKAALRHRILPPSHDDDTLSSGSDSDRNEAMGYEREQVEALFRAVQQSAGQQLGELYKHGKDYLKQLENEWTWTKSGAAFLGSYGTMAFFIPAKARGNLDLLVSAAVGGYVGLTHQWKIAYLKTALDRVEKVKEKVDKGAKVGKKDKKWIEQKEWEGVDWKEYKPKKSIKSRKDERWEKRGEPSSSKAAAGWDSQSTLVNNAGRVPDRPWEAGTSAGPSSRDAGKWDPNARSDKTWEPTGKPEKAPWEQQAVPGKR